jgi:hypothetical protein
MTTIVSYRKYIDPQITRTLKLPEGDGHHQIGTELATLPDGLTYVCLPDGVTLPIDQPDEITDSITNPAVLAPEIIVELKMASPHIRLINQRVADAIAERYTTADEIKLLRTAPSTEFNTYNAFVEDCRAWGRVEKSKLGL